MEKTNGFVASLASLPLLWLSLSFTLGIALAFWLQWSLGLWLIFAATTSLLWLINRKSAISAFSITTWPHAGLLLLALASLFLGAARYQIAQPNLNPSQLAYYNDNGEWLKLSGLLIKPPIVRDNYIELRVRIDELEFAGSNENIAVEGTLLARVSEDRDWRYGDRLILRGELQTPPEYEDFSYRAYLARQGVASLMPFAEALRIQSGQGNPLFSSLYALRQIALDRIYQLYPAPEASLLAGILLGDESGLSASLKEDFNLTGARHIIAISGFNITIIAGFSLSLLSRILRQNRAIWFTIAVILLYTVLVGAQASVVRAAIMGTLALIARQVGRRQFALNTLAITAALMALANPLILWDVGFQLSFAATLGILLYAQPLTTRTKDFLALRFSSQSIERVMGPVSEYFLITLAAQITTLPLLLYHFQRFSPLSLPTNILILPAQPALMVLGGLSVLISLVLLPLGQLLAYLAWPLAAYTIRIVELLAQPARATGAFSLPNLLGVVALYLLLALITFRPSFLKFSWPALSPAPYLAALAFLNIWLWSAALAVPNGHLQLTLLNVGEGEAFLIRSPTGRNLLINGGDSRIRLAEELGRSLPIFDRKLDWLLVAGVEQSQIGALPDSLARLSPRGLAWSGFPSATYEARQLRLKALEIGLPITNLRAAQSFDLGGGAFLDVVGISARGALLLLRMDRFQVLLPVGADPALLQALKPQLSTLQLDALFLAGGGLDEHNPPDWLSSIDAPIYLLSVEAANKPGLPSSSVLEALEGRTLLRTDLDGWIRLSSDGKQLWLETAN